MQRSLLQKKANLPGRMNQWSLTSFPKIPYITDGETDIQSVTSTSTLRGGGGDHKQNKTNIFYAERSDCCGRGRFIN